jgi:hypothetical protein
MERLWFTSKCPIIVHVFRNLIVSSGRRFLATGLSDMRRKTAQVSIYVGRFPFSATN